MKMTRWAPALPLNQDLSLIQNEMDRMLGRWFDSPRWQNQEHSFLPPVDIEETPEGYVLRMDLPGIDQKDVKVRLMGDTVTIRGERKIDTRQSEKNLHRVERVQGTFERSFVLGVPVRADQVKAAYKDGVLEISIPKAEEARPREIEIQVGS